MKVAMVRGPSLNPWEMQAYEKVAADVSLIGVGSRRGHYETEALGFPVKRLICLGEYLGFVPLGIRLMYRYFGDTQVLIGFDRFIGGYDIVHTAELRSYYSWQAVRAKKHGLIKKVVVTVWETIANSDEGNERRKEIKNEVIQGGDAFWAVTKRAKKILLKEGVEEDKIVVIPAGVDCNRFNPKRRSKKLRAALGASEKEFVVLFAGRLVKEKGVMLIPEAAKILKTQGNEGVKFVVVGSGPLRRELLETIANYGLKDKVLLSDTFDYAAMPGVFAACDLFVLPSIATQGWEEQFGMVLLEAMASGVAVVASRCGAIPEVVGEAALLIEQGNVLRLAQAIEELAGEPRKRRLLVKKGLDWVRSRYDSVKIGRQIEGLYRRILT